MVRSWQASIPYKKLGSVPKIGETSAHAPARRRVEGAIAAESISQLSRAPEQRNPSIPILADLRESGSIEQDADSVLMLYRDDYYNGDTDNAGVMDVYVRKNRHDKTGRIELRFDADKALADESPG